MRVSDLEQACRSLLIYRHVLGDEIGQAFLAQQENISLSPEDLQFQALQWATRHNGRPDTMGDPTQWATRHNGRSGRTARQFIDFLKADLIVSQSENPQS
jgi:uncharacterized protein